MSMRLGLLLAGALAVAAFAAGAGATVAFDPSTGTGFVGKGDVQTAFGWNNAMLQSNASGVTFSYSQTVDEVATCDFDNGHVTLHRGGTRSGALGAGIAYSARTNKQIDGFNLTGFKGDPTYNWGAWNLDEGTPSSAELEACIAHLNDRGFWTTDAEFTLGDPSLYVNFGSTSVLLPF